MRVDLGLVRRVEHTAGRHAGLLADAMAATSPQSGAIWARFDGGALISLGDGRYVNRATGLGLGGAPADETLDELERFYAARGLPPALEVCPWVPRPLVDELAARGYGVAWFRDVFARELDQADALAPEADVVIQPVAQSTVPAWQAILGEASTPGSPDRAVNDEFCRAAHAIPGAQDLLLVADGRPVACGSWVVIDGVAVIGAAATLVTYRGRGAQMALLRERLRRAAAAGADLVTVTALPDGQSARNLRATGFQHLYTQAVMIRR